METMSTETKSADAMAPGFTKAAALDTGVSKKTIAVSPSAVERNTADTSLKPSTSALAAK